jgi:hypothetical protein
LPSSNNVFLSLIIFLLSGDGIICFPLVPGVPVILPFDDWLDRIFGDDTFFGTCSCRLFGACAALPVGMLLDTRGIVWCHASAAFVRCDVLGAINEKTLSEPVHAKKCAMSVMLGDWFNQLLSQQMKMNKIAKDMVPNAHSAGKEPKSSV